MKSLEDVVQLSERRKRRSHRRVAAVVVLSVAFVASAIAHRQSAAFPDLIQLPVGFGPEGIAAGPGHTFYVGSLAAGTAGQILVGNLRTGEFTELVAPTGRFAAGMKYDPRSGYLFVSGGTSGRATVYDADSGAEIAVYQFVAPGPAGINDVVVTRQAAYFTDTTRPFLGRVALSRNGQPGDGTTVPLPANFGVRGPCTVGPAPRGNGIAATPDGDFLVLVHMSEGRLYLVDTTTHALTPIAISGGDLAGGAALCSTDGILLEGHTLYAVQPALNRVAVVRMAPDYRSGEVVRYITEPFASNPALVFPTTIAAFGDSLYAVTYGGDLVSPDYVVRIEK